MIAFVSVIEHHVQNHFNICSVKSIHHAFEVFNMVARLWVNAIHRVRRKIGHRAVAPIVGQLSAIDYSFFSVVKFKYR